MTRYFSCRSCGKEKEENESIFCSECILENKKMDLLEKQGKCVFCELPLKGGNINERCHCD